MPATEPVAEAATSLEVRFGDGGKSCQDRCEERGGEGTAAERPLPPPQPGIERSSPEQDGAEPAGPPKGCEIISTGSATPSAIGKACGFLGHRSQVRTTFSMTTEHARNI